MTRGRKATWAADTPTVDQTVMRVVAQTAQRAGLGEHAPHDLRRTHVAAVNKLIRREKKRLPSVVICRGGQSASKTFEVA